MSYSLRAGADSLVDSVAQVTGSVADSVADTAVQVAGGSSELISNIALWGFYAALLALVTASIVSDIRKRRLEPKIQTRERVENLLWVLAIIVSGVSIRIYEAVSNSREDGMTRYFATASIFSLIAAVFFIINFLKHKEKGIAGCAYVGLINSRSRLRCRFNGAVYDGYGGFLSRAH